MIKHLYANGDSCVFGQGLDPLEKHVYDFTDIKRKDGWGGQLAAKLGLDPLTNYTNEALPGGSNDRIVRMTTYSVLHLLEMYDPSELLVVIGWTDASRIEKFFNQYQTYVPLLPHCPPPRDAHKALHKMNELWTAYFSDGTESANRCLAQMLHLQSFLDALGVKYIFTQSIAVFPDVPHIRLDECVEHLNRVGVKKHLKWENILHDQHFMQFANGLEGSKLTACHHPDKLGHTEWANKVFNFVRSRYEMDL